MCRAGTLIAWLAIVCTGACRFDGGGVPLDATVADGPADSTAY
jgi:hypothetical protein